MKPTVGIPTTGKHTQRPAVLIKRVQQKRPGAVQVENPVKRPG